MGDESDICTGREGTLFTVGYRRCTVNKERNIILGCFEAPCVPRRLSQVTFGIIII